MKFHNNVTAPGIDGLAGRCATVRGPIAEVGSTHIGGIT